MSQDIAPSSPKNKVAPKSRASRKILRNAANFIGAQREKGKHYGMAWATKKWTPARKPKWEGGKSRC